MSFMIKIAFALQLTVISAAGLAGASTGSKSTTTESAPTEQNFNFPVLSRVSCAACSDGYNECLEEGISADSCRRAYAICFRNCL